MNTTEQLKKSIRRWVIFFMIMLALSGITAFPIVTEMQWLLEHKNLFPAALQSWIEKVHEGVSLASVKYPFLLYGTDWLAFAHLVIALLFVGVLKDPVKNKFIIDWAIVCCIFIFPTALIVGTIREIPAFHILIDCSFGVLGLVPLMIVRRKIRRVEKGL